MAIPIYDTETLPCITFPLKTTYEQSQRYLGGQASTGRLLAEINLIAKNNEEINAFYSFWKTDCNFGLNSFLIPIPVFGDTNTVTTNGGFVVKMIGNLSADKVDGHWTCKLDVEIIDVDPDLLVEQDYLLEEW